MEVDNLDIVTAVADAVASAVKSGPPPPPLPNGWVLKQSRANPGCYYYFNMDTGVTSWDTPAMQELQSQQSQQQPPPPQQQQQQQEPTTAAPQQDEEELPPPTSLVEEDGDHETPEDRSSKRRKTSTTDGASSSSKKGSSSSSAAPKEVRVLHILRKHKGSRRPSSWRNPEITATVEEAKDELRGMYEILQDEIGNPEELRATFEELAKTESDCSSAKRGGDLGYFGRKKMQPNFEAASFALKVGELTKDIVETSSGVHLILRIG